MIIVGLAGGTGAGKSSAARRFEAVGIPVVDADRIGHGLIAPGGAAVDEVVEAFGESILSCGKIDRAILGKRVFTDPTALARLNAIMQPQIAQAIALQCAKHAEAGASACIVDAALLGDSGTLEPWLEGLILVSSPAALRVGRLVAHRGLDEATAWERVRAQVDPEAKRALARWVIVNDGSLEDLHRQVDDVARALVPEVLE